MEKNKNSHGEPKLYWLSVFLKLGTLPFFKQIKLLISLLFVEVAPEIPVNLKKSFTGADGKKAGFIGFILALFFCLIVNLVWTYFNGTLRGDNPEVIYFLDDWWNLILYSIVCPSYVGLTCWLVVIVIKGWGEIKDFTKNDIDIAPKVKKQGLFKGIALGILILSVAFLLTTNYINDIMALVEENRFYWFLTETSNASESSFQLKALGVYYFLLNFSLLIVTLIAFTFFMSMYSIIMDVGYSLDSRNDIGKLEFETLKIKLSAFTEAYLVTKGIISAYILNIWIWAISPLGKGVTDNYEIAIILMAIIGVFLVSLPRYFVELQWHKLKVKSPSVDASDYEYEDLRAYNIKHIAHILDYFFIGGFLLGVIKHIVGLVS